MADNAPGSAPDSPLELGTTGWRRTLARGVRKYLRDRCGMMAGSLAFCFPVYGAFAGVVIVISWLYLVGVAILIGAELSAHTEREASAQADAPKAEMAAGR